MIPVDDLHLTGPQFGQCCMSMSKTRASSRAHFINWLASNLPLATDG